MPQCEAKTTKGTRCKRKIKKGTRCFQHLIDDKASKTKKSEKRDKVKYPIYWIIRFEEYSGRDTEDDVMTYSIVAKTDSKREKKKLIDKYTEGHQYPGTEIQTYSVKQTQQAKYLVIIVDAVGLQIDYKFLASKNPKHIGKGWKKVEDYDALNAELDEGIEPDFYRGTDDEREYAIIKPLKIENIDMID